MARFRSCFAPQQAGRLWLRLRRYGHQWMLSSYPMSDPTSQKFDRYSFSFSLSKLNSKIMSICRQRIIIDEVAGHNRLVAEKLLQFPETRWTSNMGIISNYVFRTKPPPSKHTFYYFYFRIFHLTKWHALGKLDCVVTGVLFYTPLDSAFHAEHFCIQTHLV